MDRQLRPNPLEINSKMRVHHQPDTGDRPARPPVRVGAVTDRAEGNADAIARSALSLAGDYSSVVRRSGNGALAGELQIDASRLQRASNGGHQLHPAARERMESGFGRNLGDIRVHTGGEAAELAADIGAKAFTRGSDIFFNDGEYQPATTAGDDVLAHEVAHTRQPDAADAVHRFPDTAMSMPVAWRAGTASVFRPGAGASGGVYILTSNSPQDAVQKAVVKPIFGATVLGEESGEQIVGSDRVLGAMFGLRAPQSRVVQAGTPEFADLVAVVQGHQPAKDPNDTTDLWKPVAQAQSFVVMSEVPNAKSIGGLAEDAANDIDGAKDLIRTIFNHRFLADLGKLIIGDMLLGNPDRFVFGADNLGNLMVSMENGEGRLHAIDTTAYLPKAIEPTSQHLYGNTRGDARAEMDGGAPAKLDRFFATIVHVMQTKTVGNQALPLWKRIEDGYAQHRNQLLPVFRGGWDAALVKAQSIASGADDNEFDQATAGVKKSGMVNKEGLKANAAYLVERGKGATHKDSLGRSIAINMSAWAREYDRQQLIPLADSLAASRFAPPPKRVLGADWVAPASLPPAKSLAAVAPAAGIVSSPADQKVLAAMPGDIAAAHAEVDQNLAPKKRGLMQASQPRDRNLLGHAVVDAHAVIAGAGRLAHLAAKTNAAARQFVHVPTATFEGSEAAPVKALGEFVTKMPTYLAGFMPAYISALTEVSTMLPKTSFRHATDGAKVLGHAKRVLTQLPVNMQTASDRVTKADLPTLLAAI